MSRFLRYTDGTVDHWGNMERPNVYLENGHVAYFTFAVTDQNKDQSSNCCSTGSKVIVVPFDGVSFDNDNGGLGGSGGPGGASGAGGGGGAAGMSDAGTNGGRAGDAGAPSGSGGALSTGGGGGGGASGSGAGGASSSGGASGVGGGSGGSNSGSGGRLIETLRVGIYQKSVSQFSSVTH